MDIKAETESLETKLRGVCQPPIYLNPSIYNNSDSLIFNALIQRIITAIPVDAQEILIKEGVFSGLQHYKDKEFYAIFFNFVNQNQKLIQSKTYYTILPYEQWQKKTFCAMKIRLVGAFVDIIKAKLVQHRQIKAKMQELNINQEYQDENNMDPMIPPVQESKQLYKQITDYEYPQKKKDANKKALQQKFDDQTTQNNEFQDLQNQTDKMAKALKQKIVKKDPIQLIQEQNGDDILLQHKIIQYLEKIDMKIDSLSSRVDSVEGTVKALWMEILK